MNAAAERALSGRRPRAALVLGTLLVGVATTLLSAGCEPVSADAALAAGRASAATGDHHAAAVQFARAARELRDEPAAGQAQLLLGESLLAAGEAPAAAQALARALDDGVAAVQTLPLLARALWLTGQYRKLGTLYGDVSFADDAVATATLKTRVAAAWAALADGARATAALEDALSAQPDYAPAGVLQAALLAGRGELLQAAQQTDAILAEHPTLATAWLLKGEIDWQQDRTAEASSAFARAVAIDPMLMQARLAQVGQALAAGDAAAAKEALQAMLARQPQHPLTRYAEAQVAAFSGAFGQVRELTQELMRGAPDQPGVLLLSAVAEARIGSLLIADSRLGKALQIDPDYAPARLDLAQVQLALGQPVTALQTLTPLLGSDAAPAAAKPSGAQDEAWAQVQAQAQAQALSLAGAAALQLGNRPAALQQLQRAAAAAPDNARYAAEAALARIDASAGDTQRASVMAELQALSDRTPSPYPDQAIALLALQRGDPAAALSAVQTLARKQPTAAAAPALRARALMARDDVSLGDRAAARESLQQALKIDPTRVAATAELARLDLLQGQPQAARARLQAHVAAEPGRTSARLALAAFELRSAAPIGPVLDSLSAAIQRNPTAVAPRLMLIELLLAVQQTRQALALAQQSLAVLPDDASLLEAAGRTQIAGAAYEQASSTLGHLLALAPGLARPQALLGDALRLAGQRDAAERAYRKALQSDPTSTLARAGLLQLLQTGNSRPHELVALAQQQQQALPTDISAYVAEAQAWLSVKDLSAATEAYRKGMAAGADAPHLTRAWFGALQRQGRGADAQKLAARWLAAHPQDARFAYAVAQAALDRKDWAQAELQFNAVLARQPDHAAAVNNLAWALLMQGKPGALAAAQRAAELMPARAEPLDTLARALAAADQPEQALVTQQAALRLAPGDSRVRLQLAQLALQAGDKPLARRELRRLQNLGSGFEGQADVARLMHQL